MVKKKADSLVIYFPRNEYTPDHFEILEFMIPYGDLRGLVYEKGPLVKMGLHKLAIDENDNGKTINLMRIRNWSCP